MFSITVENIDDLSLNLIACDADDIDVVFYCPGADGDPNVGDPIVITTNLNLPAGTAAYLLAERPCTMNLNPGVFEGVAQVRIGDQQGALDNLLEGRLHTVIIHERMTDTAQIGTEIYTTTTSTSTSNTIPTTTSTSQPTTSSSSSSTSTTTSAPPTTTTLACGNGMREDDEQCDPGAPGSPDRDCCSDGCRILLANINNHCGAARTLGSCEVGDKCSAKGRCLPEIVPAGYGKPCRDPLTNGPCDGGGFCDGTSPDCPTTGGEHCTADVPQPPTGTKSIDVVCEAPKQADGKPKCSAVGLESVGGGACGKRAYTRKVAGPLLDSDEDLVRRTLTLRLNRSGRERLRKEGTIDVCIRIDITLAGSILTSQTRVVALTR